VQNSTTCPRPMLLRNRRTQQHIEKRIWYGEAKQRQQIPLVLFRLDGYWIEDLGDWIEEASRAAGLKTSCLELSELFYFIFSDKRTSWAICVSPPASNTNEHKVRSHYS
jgi:hypothetical protein